MKKLTAILLSVLLLCTAVTAVSAAGVDDGSLLVTEKDGIKYFGTKATDYATEFVAANGSGKSFVRYTVDLTGDGSTDICDLVQQYIAPADIDGSGTADEADCAIIRKVLLGQSDF